MQLAMATEKTCLKLRQQQSTHFANMRLRRSKALKFLSGLAQSQFFSLFFWGVVQPYLFSAECWLAAFGFSAVPMHTTLVNEEKIKKGRIHLLVVLSTSRRLKAKTHMGLNMHFQSVSLHL